MANFALSATLVLVGLCFLYIPFHYEIYVAFAAMMAVTFTGAFVPLLEKKHKKGFRSVLEDFP